MYGILFWFSSRLIYFCHLLKQCRAVEILVSSSFFEQMNFEQMTLLRFFFSLQFRLKLRFSKKRQLGENCDPHGVTNEKKKKLEKVEHFCSKLFFVEGKKVLHKKKWTFKLLEILHWHLGLSFHNNLLLGFTFNSHKIPNLIHYSSSFCREHNGIKDKKNLYFELKMAPK